MEDNKNAYFSNLDSLVQHLTFKFGKLTPLKLQKTLYFLFALYAGIYNGDEEEGVQEETYNMPEYLFNASFEAWTYGPVIREVYSKNKFNDRYDRVEYPFDQDNPVDVEIEKFINDVGEQIISMSDFSLVDRSHEDTTWKEAIEKGNSTTMLNEDIANEYREIIKKGK